MKIENKIMTKQKGKEKKKNFGKNKKRSIFTNAGKSFDENLSLKEMREKSNSNARHGSSVHGCGREYVDSIENSFGKYHEYFDQANSRDYTHRINLAGTCKLRTYSKGYSLLTAPEIYLIDAYSPKRCKTNKEVWAHCNLIIKRQLASGRDAIIEEFEDWNN